MTESIEVNFVSLEHHLGHRISVIGGGGKTTLARALSAKLGLPFVELDAIHHLPNWVERDAESFKIKVSEALEAARDGWVVDGSYAGKLEGLVFGKADMIVWVNMPWRVMFWRVFKRSVQRAVDKQIICGENTESWRQMFSRNSLLWYHIKTRKLYPRRLQRVIPYTKPGVPVINIQSPRELNNFYELHGLVRR